MPFTTFEAVLKEVSNDTVIVARIVGEGEHFFLILKQGPTPRRFFLALLPFFLLVLLEVLLERQLFI